MESVEIKDVKNQLSTLLKQIDGSGIQDNDININDDMAIIHSDLLQETYMVVEGIISQIDSIEFAKDEVFEYDSNREQDCKDELENMGYDFDGKSIYTPTCEELDASLCECIDYLELCEYTFIGFID